MIFLSPAHAHMFIIVSLKQGACFFVCLLFALFAALFALYMYIAFDLQSKHISNGYKFYLLRTQQEHQNENVSL